VSACLDLSGSLGHFRIRWTGQKKLPGQHLECLPKSQLSVKLTFRETFLGLTMSPTDSYSRKVNFRSSLPKMQLSAKLTFRVNFGKSCEKKLFLVSIIAFFLLYYVGFNTKDSYDLPFLPSINHRGSPALNPSTSIYFFVERFPWLGNPIGIP
jgi:hypothetical protein